MGSNNWVKAMREIKSNLFYIQTSHGSGTGFLVASLFLQNLFVVVTAKHVIEQASKDHESIELVHSGTYENVILKQSPKRPNLFDLRKNERLIITLTNEFSDLALIFFRKDDLSLYLEPLEFLNEDIALSWGTEVGWCGFPNLIPEYSFIPFFFTGRISAVIQDCNDKRYLIDGRAFPGNSGGPVFFIDESKNVKIFGIMSSILFTDLGKSEKMVQIPALSLAVSINPIQTLIQALIQKNVDAINRVIKKKEGSKL